MSTASGTGAPPVQLDLELCKACGVCIKLCPEKVFDHDALGYPVIARPDDCSRCLICELHCPDFAIEVKRRERKPRRAATAGTAGASTDQAVTHADLVTATRGVDEEHLACTHDGEED